MKATEQIRTIKTPVACRRHDTTLNDTRLSDSELRVSVGLVPPFRILNYCTTVLLNIRPKPPRSEATLYEYSKRVCLTSLLLSRRHRSNRARPPAPPVGISPSSTRHRRARQRRSCTPVVPPPPAALPRLCRRLPRRHHQKWYSAWHRSRPHHPGHA